MYADIEALVLSGELFNGPERSSSPTRTPSPDSGWHDDELESADDKDYDSDAERRKAFDASLEQKQSIGMGPGRTGVKGVIRDRDEAVEIGKEKQAREYEEMRERMEKSGIGMGGKTFLEEEREKLRDGSGEKVDRLVLDEMEKGRKEERTDLFGRRREGRFGHLREVGVKGFLPAVENEERGVWVVVHLYEPSLERCYILDDTLARLARNYPDTKFIRSRASGLGFASKGTSSSRTANPASVSSISNSRPIPGRFDDFDDDDPYADIPSDDALEKIVEYDEDDEYEVSEEVEVDTDMLPTMLVYRDGELVHNWVRVDWEAGEGGIEELLAKYHLLPRAESILGTGGGNCGLPSDDDEDLIWDDEDE